MSAIFFVIIIICFIAIAAFLLEVALSNIKEDIIEEVLDRLEVEDDGLNYCAEYYKQQKEKNNGK